LNQQYEESIKLFDEVIKEVCDKYHKATAVLSDICKHVSVMYEKNAEKVLNKGSSTYFDLLKESLRYAHISAIEARKDCDKWYRCAQIAFKIPRRVSDTQTKVGNHFQPTYFYNRAVKVLKAEAPDDIFRIMDLKIEKIRLVYEPINNTASIARTLEKQIELFTSQVKGKNIREGEVAWRLRLLKKYRYKNLYSQGKIKKALK
jgi:hypothetical protein